MLRNRHLIEKHVEFVSYTGKYPNLCGGMLTLKIDGKEVKFGLRFEFAQKNDGLADHPRFWQSDGDRNEWTVDVELIPQEYRKYAREIDEVVNANFERCCCGGCS